MKISDQAKEVLKTILKENNLDGLRVEIQESCCGKSPVIGLDTFGENEQPQMINDIAVIIPEDAKEAVEDLEIDVVDDQLVVLGSSCSCSDDCGHCH